MTNYAKPTPVRRLARVLSIILLAGLVLPAARCAYTPHTESSAYSGPSSGIEPAGPQLDWSVGGSPPGGPGVNLMALINAQRNSTGSASLVWHDALRTVAAFHSRDMVDHNYLSLISNDGYDVFQTLVSLNPRITFDDAYAVVYQYPSGSTAAQRFAAIMAQPGTAAALMDPTMSQIGFFRVTGQNNLEYETLILGRNVVP